MPVVKIAGIVPDYRISDRTVYWRSIYEACRTKRIGTTDLAPTLHKTIAGLTHPVTFGLGTEQNGSSFQIEQARILDRDILTGFIGVIDEDDQRKIDPFHCGFRESMHFEFDPLIAGGHVYFISPPGEVSSKINADGRPSPHIYYRLPQSDPRDPDRFAGGQQIVEKSTRGHIDNIFSRGLGCFHYVLKELGLQGLEIS